MFGGTYARGAAAEAVSGAAWLQAMLDVEAALARACARERLITDADAEAIAAACRPERFDLGALEREGGEHASPVVGLVAALRELVGPQVAPAVHRGATSQDVVDSAAMLVARRALVPLLTDAAAVADAAAALATTHRATPMAGRTLLRQALPTTFGLHAAGWLTAVDAARLELGRVAGQGLAVQMGGPVGTRAPAVGAHVAEALGLAVPVVPWHTDRTRVGALGAALGVLAGALGKIALDVVLLGQDEVGEVREGGADGGRSSAMAHKRNPVAAVSVRACAARTPGLVATLLAVMPQEHQRGGGTWQAEWGTLGDLLALAGSATAWARELLEHLEVDPARMAENLGRLATAGVVEAADPARHLGAAEALAGAALDAHRAAADDDARREAADRARQAGDGAARRAVRRGPRGAPAVLHRVLSGPSDGPPLVLGSSLGTTNAMWAPQAEALSRTHRVIAFDHRGHGASPVPAGPYAVEDLGGDVLALLDRLEIARASWCGISLGGMVGMWLAAHAPERIDRLVLVCTSAHLPPAEGWHERAATVRAAGSVEPVADAVVARWLTADWASAHPRERTALSAMLVATPPEGYAACCEAIADLDLRADLHRITAPTLVVAGAQDQATPPAHGLRIATAIPGARLEQLEPAAHLASVEQAAAVTRLITDHLATTLGAP